MNGNIGLRAVLVALCLGMSLPATAAESGTIEEIVAILRSEGLIDAATQQRLLAKQREEQQRHAQVDKGPLRGVEWTADMRLRYEATQFAANGLPAPEDRYRFRYRARLGFEKQLGERLRAGLRLASNVSSGDTGGARGTNVSFGEQADFAPDDLYIDRAWVDFELYDDEVSVHLVAGRLANPFRWDAGPDKLTWDPDINPEGGYLRAQMAIGRDARAWAKLGAFVIDELAGSSDPTLLALQVGSSVRLSRRIELGSRLSGYDWRSLDSSFVARALAAGNLASAFTGRARIGELGAWARFATRADWPLLVYLNVQRNFTAESAVLGGVPTDEENVAWTTGIEIGDARKIGRFGLAWFRAEANALVANFSDSDLLDGQTNRQGITAYAARRLTPHVELRLTFYDAHEIESTSPFAASLGGADRRRLQTDVLFSF